MWGEGRHADSFQIAGAILHYARRQEQISADLFYDGTVNQNQEKTGVAKGHGVVRWREPSGPQLRRTP